MRSNNITKIFISKKGMREYVEFFFFAKMHWQI